MAKRERNATESEKWYHTATSEDDIKKECMDRLKAISGQELNAVAWLIDTFTQNKSW